MIHSCYGTSFKIYSSDSLINSSNASKFLNIFLNKCFLGFFQEFFFFFTKSISNFYWNYWKFPIFSRFILRDSEFRICFLGNLPWTSSKYTSRNLFRKSYCNVIVRFLQEFLLKFIKWFLYQFYQEVLIQKCFRNFELELLQFHDPKSERSNYLILVWISSTSDHQKLNNDFNYRSF